MLVRLALLLGAGGQASAVVRSAFLTLQRRSRRVVDPVERVEFLQEQVVHLTRSFAAGPAVPEAADGRHQPVLDALSTLPRPAQDLLLVSHDLGAFGPPLAGIMRMSVRSTNRQLEAALSSLTAALGDGRQVEAVSSALAEALAGGMRSVRVPADPELAHLLASPQRVPRGGRVRGQYVAVAGIVAFAVGTSGAVLSGEQQAELPTVAPTASPTATASPAPVAMQAVVRQVPVYYVGRADRRLYRELRNLPASSSLARAGVEALFTLAPSDPDYTSLWSGTLLSVTLEGATLTVDLEAEAFEAIEPNDVGAAIDEMVYTASELLERPDLRVRFRADGAAPPAPFEAEDGGFRREGLRPMPGLWLTSPRNQSVLGVGSLTVTGVSKPQWGAPVVTITDRETGDRVANSIAQTSLSPNAEGWLVWSVEVPLPAAGTYDVVATASLTAGPETKDVQSVDNKVIRVVG